MVNWKELDNMKLKEQDCVIKDGFVELTLDRLGKNPCVRKIPVKYKELMIQDIYGDFTTPIWDTVKDRKTKKVFGLGKFWIYNPETDKFILLDASLKVMINL